MDKFTANLLPLLTLSFITGIYAGSIYPQELTPAFWYVLLAFFFLIMLGNVFFNKTAEFKLAVPLFFVLGLVFWLHADYVRGDDIGRIAGENATIEGQVVEIPVFRKIRSDTTQEQYILEATALKDLPGNQNTPVSVSGRIKINVYAKDTTDNPLKINYGDKINVYGEINEIHTFNNPGRIDTLTDMKRQGISALLSAKKEDIKILARGNKENSWLQKLADWQQDVLNTMKNRMSDNEKGILSALIFGKSEGITQTAFKDFSTTGLIHILSVSGAHIAIVAGVINWLGLTLRLPPKLTGFLTLAGILLYAVISGLTSTVIRAAIMGAILVFAVIFQRDHDSKNALALAALVMLVFSPLLIYNISFQLSFSATMGIIFFYKKSSEYLSFLPECLRAPFVVTIAAQLGSLPFLAWYFNNLSLIALFANLIVLPVIEVALIIGLAGCAIHLFFPFAAGIIFVLAALLIGAGVELTALLAKIPGAVLYLPSVDVLGGIIYYHFLFWLYDYKINFLPSRSCVFNYFKTKKTAAAALFVLISFSLGVWHFYPKPMAVHFIDVGQGDAALVATPKGKTILIDTGGFLTFDGSAPSFDVGERVIAPYLEHYGFRSVDYLILTHAHQDHAGGAAGVAANLSVNNIILAKEPPAAAITNLLRTAPAAPVFFASAGQSFQLDGVLVTIEHAGHNSTPDNSNEISNIVSVKYGEHSFLFTGDLEKEGEAEMLSKGILPFTVLKVAHHGSNTSSGKEFLAAVSPRYAVISVGYNNRFSHPHQDVVKRLLTENIKIYRTDENGAVVFYTDGENMEIESFK